MKQTFEDILNTDVNENQSIMAIMIPYDDPNLPAGDYKVIWDRRNEEEIEMARTQFREWKKKGYVPYSVEKSGNRGVVLDAFDPEAGKIIFAPPMQGGSECLPLTAVTI